AVDGPSGSGKGTVSQLLAARLGWHYLDSGALYRAVGLAAERAGVDFADAAALAAVARELRLRFLPRPDGPPAVILDGEDITDALRSEAAGDAASRVAAVPAVRR